MPNASGKYKLNSFQEFQRHQGRRLSVLQCYYNGPAVWQYVQVLCGRHPSLYSFLSDRIISKTALSRGKISASSARCLLYLVQILPGECVSAVKLVYKCALKTDFGCRGFFLCVCVPALCIYAGLKSLVSPSPIPPAALISLLNSFLSLRFSHVQVCSFLISPRLTSPPPTQHISNEGCDRGR